MGQGPNGCWVSQPLFQKQAILNSRIIFASSTEKNKDLLDIRSVCVTRYITPLREGGSLPAVAEADDGFKYVIKFRGAGHGVKALIAEFIGGELARKVGLKVPEIVFADLDPAFGRGEADEEIQDLLKTSQGLNIGLHFLSGAITFDPVVNDVDAELASDIVWLDAYLTNIDRTVKNTNMLTWNKELWLIDHGATLYFHHSWDQWQKHATGKFDFISQHVLLPSATKLAASNEKMHALITTSFIETLIKMIPETWLTWEGSGLTSHEIRAVYREFLLIRLEHSDIFLKTAEDARKALV